MKKVLWLIVCLMTMVMSANAHNTHYPTYTIDGITYEMDGSWDGCGTYFWRVQKVHKSNNKTIVIPSKVPIEKEQRTKWSGEELQVVGIGSEAFSECIYLDSLVISDGITIGDNPNTFKGCRPLEYLYYSNGGYRGLANWGDGLGPYHAMEYTGLSCKTFETSLGCAEKPFWTTIGKTLEKIIIRETNGVSTCMDSCCPCLKTIVCYAANPPYTRAAHSPNTYTCSNAYITFESWQWSTITLYVPRESLEKYYFDKVWGEIDNIYAIDEMNSATTSINSITNETMENDAWYTINGTKIDNPTKGIYIKNGKKYIIK